MLYTIGNYSENTIHVIIAGQCLKEKGGIVYTTHKDAIAAAKRNGVNYRVYGLRTVVENTEIVEGNRILKQNAYMCMPN